MCYKVHHPDGFAVRQEGNADLVFSIFIMRMAAFECVANSGFQFFGLPYIFTRSIETIPHQDASFQYKTLIPCTLYGRHDKFDPTHSHLIPAIIHKVHQAKQNGQETVEIWGDGTARREFMYAGDLADAILRAITNFDSLPAYMNVGLGHDHTINEYYQAAAEVMGYTGGFTHDLSKPVGMARKLVSVDRQQTWGWSARHDLRDGIEKTYDYYLKECQQ